MGSRKRGGGNFLMPCGMPRRSSPRPFAVQAVALGLTGSYRLEDGGKHIASWRVLPPSLMPGTKNGKAIAELSLGVSGVTPLALPSLFPIDQAWSSLPDRTLVVRAALR